MPPLQFCANLTWLFTELPEIMEAAWPYEEDLQELKRARKKPPGRRAGARGSPGERAEFRRGLEQAMEYAQFCSAKVAKEMENIFIQNLDYAADLLSKKDMTGLIEPINTRITDPAYFLDSPHHAVAILERLGKPNLKLQMDVFHWQIMDGNLTQNILKYFPLIGHVQVAQVPVRNEPDTPGELNYSYLWDVLERQHYQGFVGCEYRPLGGTAAGLGWLRDYWTRTEAQG
ncbi:hypothetical protein WMY93_027260 [Mugilogobius chulae]|uniref:Xylose isomerase-like TIM barrel domain-containing protein n=1 Tax=Mugilogobius chulae TaxID=88201 RepID=A0AAW0MWT2_9GOBI